MHALTCELLEPGSIAYAMLPTYYDASKFIACKVHIDWVYNSDTCIFYHCTIAELLNDAAYNKQVLQCCKLRCIERQTGKVLLATPAIKQFSLDNASMLQDLQAWQQQYILDIPAPFACSAKQKLLQMQQDIIAYFTTILNNTKHAIR